MTAVKLIILTDWISGPLSQGIKLFILFIKKYYFSVIVFTLEVVDLVDVTDVKYTEFKTKCPD